MAQNYFTTNCDAHATDWTVVTDTGNGGHSDDTTNKMEGTGSFETHTAAGAAGTVDATKTLPTAAGTKNMMHFHGHLMVNNDSTPGTSPAAPTLVAGSYIQILQIRNVGATEGFNLLLWGAAGTTQAFKFASTNMAVSSTLYTDDGISPGAFHDVDYYYFKHPSAGWRQLWFDGVKVLEETGIDADNAATITQCRVGCISKGNNGNGGYVWWDAIVVDNALPTTLPAGVDILDSSFVAGNSLAYDAETLSSVTVSYPAGVSTSCVKYLAVGDPADNGFHTRTFPAQGSGAYLLWDEQFHIDDDAEAGATFPASLKLINAASGGGIVLGYITPQTANQYKLKISLRTTSGAASEIASVTTAAKYSIEAFIQVQLYVYLHASVGRIALKVGGVLAAEASGLNTLPGGSINTLLQGLWAASADSDTGYHDDIFLDNTQYASWISDLGTPLRRRIVAPTKNTASLGTALGYVG